MIRSALTIATTAALVAVPFSTSQAATGVSTQDATFLKAAAAADLAEISLGKVAEVKGTTAEARHFAAKVIADHTMALKDKRVVAKALDITLPTAPTAAMKAVAKAVSAKSGISFDLSYLTAEKVGHLANIANGAKEIQLGSNARIKGQAVDTSPMLAYHLWLDEQYLGWVTKAAAS